MKGVEHRPLTLVPAAPSHPFDAFLKAVFSSVLALLLAWRLFVFDQQDSDESEEEQRASTSCPMEGGSAGGGASGTVPGQSSIVGLLTTDDILSEVPSSSEGSGCELSSGSDTGVEHPRGPPPPPPLLMQQQSPYLDAIIEEESDDLRSVSSASSQQFASPRTVVTASPPAIADDSIENIPPPKSPPIPPTPPPAEPTAVRTPAAPFPEELTRLVREALAAEEERENQPFEPTETPTGDLLIVVEEAMKDPVVESEQKPDKDDDRIAETSQEAATTSETVKEAPVEREPVVEMSYAEEKNQEPNGSGQPSLLERLYAEEVTSRTEDADRDQEEIEYNNVGQNVQPPSVMEDTLSLNSVSIPLDQSRDSVLDNLLDNSITSQPHDEEAIVKRSTTNLLKDESASAATNGGGGVRTNGFGRTVNDYTSQRDDSFPPPPLPPPPPPPPSSGNRIDVEKSRERMARYAQVYADAPRSRVYSDDLLDADPGMSSPPSEPPPPPPFHIPSNVSQKSYRSSREDLLSDHAPSRSTVREIPVHRAPSAAPSASTVTVLDYRGLPGTTIAPINGDVQEEYYRREVMTRTLVTRSTEALSAAPPLSRSSPIERERSYVTYPDGTREERTVDYTVKYVRNVEEEERRIKEQQDRRRIDEEERRRREDEARREWELRERTELERLRREWERKEREKEGVRAERERREVDRITADRLERERLERDRRAQWDRLEQERRELEEKELERRRQIERERLEAERLEEERRERERLERERERLERERLERERIEWERQERERIERERLEMERLEIERIERIKRERIEQEKRDREKEREEAERLAREREELERIERERREIEIRERELIEAQRREAELRERERLEDDAREARRREEELRAAELLADIQRQAEERERLRKLAEREEIERIERLRREQERREFDRQEAERRERDRLEEERREKELIDAQRRAKEAREHERLEDEKKERERQLEEQRERERRDLERRAAAERERQRQLEEAKERERINALERAAKERLNERLLEQERERQRADLERRTAELKEIERRETEKRDRERLEEERALAELRDKERRMAEQRERERREAAEREAQRRKDDHRSRERLDLIVREREERERFAEEKRRLLADKEARDRKKNLLTSRETLEKLTRKPYFSRENLNTEVTTKIERQVIERVDRNVWNDDIRYPPHHYSTSSPLELTDDPPRERLYNTRTGEDFRDRDAISRSSRYRAKMEKARRDFITGAPESGTPADYGGERFRKSTDDIVRNKPEYRGPLLQKFHDGEFSSKKDLDKDLPYPRVGPSQYSQEYERLKEEVERKYAEYRQRLSQPNLYSRARTWSTSYLQTDVDTGLGEIASTHRQVEETNLDDVHRRSQSGLDYERISRRDTVDAPPETVHTRSKSADYLMDRRMREESEPPENQLQKVMGDSPRPSEQEMRFRKSVEKLHVPDWYRENRPTGKATDLDREATSTTRYESTTTRYEPATRYEPSSASRYEPSPATRYGQPWSYDSSALPPAQPSYRSASAYPSYQPPPTTTASSLSPVGGVSIPTGMFDRYKDEIEDLRRSRTSLHQLSVAATKPEPPVPAVRKSLSHETLSMRQTQTQTVEVTSHRALPGYTVSEVPEGWNHPGNRNSRVIEVADTFVGQRSQGDGATQRYGGRVTLEEVLDSIFQQTPPRASSTSDPSLPQADNIFEGNRDGPGIYTQNYLLMDQVIKQPERADRNDSSSAALTAIEQGNWQQLELPMSPAITAIPTIALEAVDSRIGLDTSSDVPLLASTLSVREDVNAQWYMSKVARDGYANHGRGSVNIRLNSPHIARTYVERGWEDLNRAQPTQLLFYFTVANLVEDRKEPSLIALCKRYDPKDKFILSVSIIADIEHCPSTPVPERVNFALPQPEAYISDQQLLQDYRTAVPTDV